MRALPLLLLAAARTSLSSSSSGGVRTIQSAESSPREHPDRLTDKGTTPWTTDAAAADASHYTLHVDTGIAYQTINGFGGAFTDSSASVFAQLNATMQARVVDMFWGEGGQRYNLARLPIGATDFSTSVYSYEGGQG